jgi:hypothetical protein
MAKTVQLTDEETDVVQETRAEAARAGISVAEYLHRKIQASPRKLTNDELFAMMAALPPLDIESSAGIIRELRGPLPGDDDHHR